MIIVYKKNYPFGGQNIIFAHFGATFDLVGQIDAKNVLLPKRLCSFRNGKPDIKNFSRTILILRKLFFVQLLFGEVANVKWDDIDVHTLTSFIKVTNLTLYNTVYIIQLHSTFNKMSQDFFRVQLSEPILTFKALPSFIQAANDNNSDGLKRLIRKVFSFDL